MNEQELKDRTKQFALRVIKLVEALTNTIAGRAIGNQLVRSGTSVGANYRAACRSGSKPGFVAKLGIVAEEADESTFWMELIMAAGLLRPELIQPLQREANELAAIFTASGRTAKVNNPKSKMLDATTKRRIDTARAILVGKVPDPKSQVEQITIALIYKFMDDMDLEAEELGGQRKFFAGDFARYGWARLMRSGLGGHEMLNLYAEAIAKMPENPGIPPLFRDIFKNAFLPYRDPETLRAFLKVIDEFEYDHSERLGDSFEYLLYVLGSQGDAGQFRTPRHIIDFIVAIVDPNKTETVLDPACGTAGRSRRIRVSRTS